MSLSNEYSGLISFRIDWFDLHAVQGTLKTLLQHFSSKASVLWCSAFFMVQLSHPYMITGKTIALTRCSFDGKVMSLLFNMLSRLVIAFLPMIIHIQFQFTCSVVSDCETLPPPHGLQHARLPCPSPTPRACSNSSQWCHLTISSSVITFSYLQSFPASGSFLRSQFLNQVAKVLELQHQSFRWIFRTNFF